MKNDIQKEFEKITMPYDCAEEIRQNLDKRLYCRKNNRIVFRTLLAASVIVCLLASVAAFGVSKGWLDEFLGSSEGVDSVRELQLSAQDGKMKVTLDRMLMDGPFVYLQVSVQTEGDLNAAEAFEGNPAIVESGIEQRLYTTYSDGWMNLPLSERGRKMTNLEVLPSEGPSRTWRITRLDDRSDIHFCSYTMQILLGEIPANYEGMNLTLRLDKLRTWKSVGNDGFMTEEEAEPIIEETIILSDSKAALRTMEDGRRVKVHTLGVQIQGADFKACETNGVWNSGVIMEDGTKLSFQYGWSTQDYFVEDMQWNIGVLKEVIDPMEVVAIYVGNTIYPLND